MSESKRYLVWLNGELTASVPEADAPTSQNCARSVDCVPEHEARLAPKAWEALRELADWMLNWHGAGYPQREAWDDEGAHALWLRAQAALRALEGEEGADA